MNLNSLPSSFVPFDRVALCSNGLQNVKVLFLLSQNVPLLVGKGTDGPLVWLERPVFTAPNQPPANWIPMVEENRPADPVVSVVHPQPKQTLVVVRQNILLDCVAKEDDLLEIRRIDLRPIGILIYGTPSSLVFVNQTFTGNFFTNTEATFKAG